MSVESAFPPNPRNGRSDEAPVAFLVVREGNDWRDVFRLTPGQVTTIGRAPTNRIVIHDEICSRNHCEVFQSGQSWTLRDLNSRNGTLLDGKRVEGDSILKCGDLIQIGSCRLGFTEDLTRPFPELDETDGGEIVDHDTETESDLVFDQPTVELEPAIIHRQRRTRYSGTGDGEISRDRTSKELARLYRLAIEMAAARNERELADVVLTGLFAETCADIGAILVLPDGVSSVSARPRDLQVLAYKAQGDFPYQKVSEYLSDAVLRDGEAVLARDIGDDSRLASRDHLGEIYAKSVICAPIRSGEIVKGLIHLYSTRRDKPLEPQALEFTLALADQVAVALENLKEKASLVHGLARIRNENIKLRQQLRLEQQLVGDSAVILQLRESISRIAPTGATVLVRGESGVGKELVARGIHFSSDRRDGPFVCMNCAALSESLLESELFGHEKGSFTGAVDRKIGKFEQADKGSLFLDEVGEMSLPVQAKFLRVLEGHAFERVGGRTTVNADVRVIAATNRNLEEAVEAGAFRKDLYYRLHVVELSVEPLRNRRSDIPLLANFFLERFVNKTGRPVRGFTSGAIDRMMRYDWPGNVRELQNTIERAVILSAGELVSPDDISLTGLTERTETSAAPPSVPEIFEPVSLEEVERNHIAKTLESNDWHKSRTAQILGIERSTLDRKLKKYGIDRGN